MLKCAFCLLETENNFAVELLVCEHIVKLVIYNLNLISTSNCIADYIVNFELLHTISAFYIPIFSKVTISVLPHNTLLIMVGCRRASRRQDDQDAVSTGYFRREVTFH